MRIRFLSNYEVKQQNTVDDHYFIRLKNRLTGNSISSGLLNDHNQRIKDKTITKLMNELKELEDSERK